MVSKNVGKSTISVRHFPTFHNRHLHTDTDLMQLMTLFFYHVQSISDCSDFVEASKATL